MKKMLMLAVLGLFGLTASAQTVKKEVKQCDKAQVEVKDCCKDKAQAAAEVKDCCKDKAQAAQQVKEEECCKKNAEGKEECSKPKDQQCDKCKKNNVQLKEAKSGELKPQGTMKTKKTSKRAQKIQAGLQTK